MAGKSKNEVGNRYGSLTVLEYAGVSGTGSNTMAMWKCKCDCGNTITTRGTLRSGRVKSCYCRINRAETHHKCETKEYKIWVAMRRRCDGRDHQNATDRYASRGITVCEEWNNDFRKFLSDMGPIPSMKHSIDREDNDKGYYKDNCRWATAKEQQRNTSVNVNITHDGKTMCVSAWAEHLGIKPKFIFTRVKRKDMAQIILDARCKGLIS